MRIASLLLGVFLAACGTSSTTVPTRDGGATTDGGAPAADGGSPAADGGSRTDGGADAGADAGVLQDATCAAPTPITAGTPVNGTLVGRGRYMSPSADNCDGLDPQSTYDSADAIYSITVPAHKVLDVTLHTLTDWDSALLVLDPSQCVANPTCLASADFQVADTTADEDVLYGNRSATDKQVLVVVTGLQDPSAPLGEFTLTATTRDPIAGDLCTSPIAIADAGTIAGTMVGALDDLAPDSTGCPGLDDTVGPYTTPDVFYSLTLPNATTLSVSVAANDPNDDFAVYAITAGQCSASAPVCVGAADANAQTTDPEHFTYSNTTGSAQDLIIGIEVFTFGENTFNLTVGFSPVSGDGGAPSDGGAPPSDGGADGG